MSLDVVIEAKRPEDAAEEVRLEHLSNFKWILARHRFRVPKVLVAAKSLVKYPPLPIVTAPSHGKMSGTFICGTFFDVEKFTRMRRIGKGKIRDFITELLDRPPGGDAPGSPAKRYR